MNPITSVLLGVCAALFALRLLRELSSSGSGGGGEGAERQVLGFRPGMVDVEVSGSQPYRPFSGQGHRLSSGPGLPLAREEAAAG